ncbi:Z-ring formation inhibitor MciZ [Microbacteriaceae bacterium 4G12]
MKVYISPKRVLLVGKAWEIINKLREYSQQYETVASWLQDNICETWRPHVTIHNKEGS